MGTTELRVAGAQLRVTRDVAENQAAILRTIDYGIEEHADVVLTPEGSLSGYTRHFDQAEVARALEVVTSHARRSGIGLALGTCFVEPEHAGDGLSDNQLRFYDREGSYLGCHSKILTGGRVTRETRIGPPAQWADGSAAGARPLRTFRLQGLLVGGLICNDLWANPGWTPIPDPHLSQQLAGMGAQIVFHAVYAGGSSDGWSGVARAYHETNLRLRARAGGLWIVTANTCEPIDLPNAAPSGVVDPDGNWAVQAAPQGEAFFAYTIAVDSEGAGTN